MDQKEILIQEVDRYLMGEMDEATKINFEKRLVNDPDVRKEVELQKLVIKTVRKRQLQRIIQKEESKITRSKLIRKLIAIGSFATAASFAGFLYMGYLNNCAGLANRYYVAYANVYELPSRGGESLHPTQADSLFFDALKQLEKGNNRSAAKQLATLQTRQTELHAVTDNAVKWYLSLAYLKSGKKEKAILILHQVLDTNTGEFKTEAKNLLQELEK